jgi:hypothetical protein
VSADEEQDERTPPPVDLSRGFGRMRPERRREVARRGGISAHNAGTAHEFTSAEARIAGRLGGLAKAAKRARHST